MEVLVIKSGGAILRKFGKSRDPRIVIVKAPCYLAPSIKTSSPTNIALLTDCQAYATVNIQACLNNIPVGLGLDLEALESSCTGVIDE